ncbi:TniQ family protein [Duganella sp. Root1480D1]|uniref:TniQ family protein n=1 Tax=Duganella sp. Root1480D1 TaxID=1736471 RepID=UPI0009EB21C8|nr:TniQ family protein [Duganella sp. Root1480D1]
MSVTGLLYVPDQVAGESLRGYLRRLAIGNGYPGSRELVQAAGFKFTNAALVNDIDAILNSLGVPASKVHSASPKQSQQLAENFYERTMYEPVCVQCLQEAERLKKVWSHCLVVACPEHQCMLIDRCPQCHEMLKTTRAGIATCDCGFDLRNASPTEATPIQSWSSARMVGDMRSIRFVDEIGNEDDYRHLADLIFHMSIRSDPKIKIKPGSAIRPKTIDDAATLIQPILEILEDLHPRLTTHIKARFAAGNQDAFNLHGRLGSWYRSLEQICKKSGAFPVIWEIFSDAVFDNFDGFMRGQAGLSPSPERRRQYLGVAEAAKLIGVSKPALQEAIERKQIHVRTGCEGINYAVHMISREQCETARQLRASWMTPADACAFLGVPKSVLRHLVNADIVTPDQEWAQTVFKAGPFDKEQLIGLREYLGGAIQARATRRTFRLDQIDARRTVDLKALVRIYRAIFSGDLKPTGRSENEGLAGFLFPADEVMQYLGAAALDEGLTLSQLAQATGWKYHSIAGWTHQNLLESETVILQGRRSRVVTVEGLANFRRKWIPVSEIAAAMGSKGSAVTRHLESKGIVIVGQTHEADGAARGGLIRISDLGRLAGLVGSISRKSNETSRGEHVD